MKNVVIIDIDTERVDDKGNPVVVEFGKLEEHGQPTTKEEAKAMIHVDIRSLTEGLVTLVMTSELNGWGKKEDYFAGITAQLREGLQMEEPTD